jgi:hypothetical protein
MSRKYLIKTTTLKSHFGSKPILRQTERASSSC